MKECNSITVTRSTACENIGGIDYKVLIDLKKLQGKKEPYFNATDLVKQYNDHHGKKKQLGDWLRLKDTRELIVKLEDLYTGIPVKRFVEKRGSGRSRSTWIHKELFLHMMYWLDVDHKIAIMKFVDNIVKDISLVLEKREAIKQPTKDRNESLEYLSKALTILHPDSSRGSRLYLHISQKINIAVFGTATKNREDGTKEDLIKINDMEHFTEFMARFSIRKYDTPEDARQRVFSSLKQDYSLLSQPI